VAVPALTAEPKRNARAKAKAEPKVGCAGKTRDGTPCSRKVPASVRYCCKHKGDELIVIEGQGFICGYMGCTAITALKEHCAKCKALQEKDVVMCEQEVPAAGAGGVAAATTPSGPVELAVCEYCRDKPANGNTKYCEDCAVKLEKELGLADEGDEEKHEDGVGGGTEPPTAPAVAVEQAPTAPAAAVEPAPTAPGVPVEHKDGVGGIAGPSTAPGVPVEHSSAAPGGPVELGDGAVRAKSPAAPGAPVEQASDAPATAVEQAPTASAANEIFKFCGICAKPKPSDSCVSCTKCRDYVIENEVKPCEGCQLLAKQANPDATLCEKHAQMFDFVFFKARMLTAADDGSAKGSAEVDTLMANQ
jgi:hypothetical protein